MRFTAFVILILLAAACSKTSSPCPGGDPGEYYLYFELDDAFLDDVIVEVSSMIKSVDIKTGAAWEASNVNWETLQISPEASDQIGRRLFGPFYYTMGFEPCDLNERKGWVRDQLYQLRFDGSGVGMLRFRDTTGFDPTTRRFSFCLNEEKLEVTGDLDMGMGSVSFVKIRRNLDN
jgi:hypothetical protein